MAKSTKTTIEFSSDASTALDQLSGALETTKAEVLRSALSLFVYVVNNLRGTSRSLAIVSDEGGQMKIEKVIAVPSLMAKHVASVVGA
jgi:predicted transcriptional regulator